MPTQIAPTPIVTGASAKKILKQTKIKPSKESDDRIRILAQMFAVKEK